jgi:uncharacterized protein (TIGR03437 family)
MRFWIVLCLPLRMKLRLSLIGVIGFLSSVSVFAQCSTFPANLIPFSSVTYVTASNAAGDQLVVGALAGGVNTLGQLPIPSAANQIYCDAVQLAPGQFFPNVYVPSTQERSGNFSAFGGVLLNPTNGQPYPGGIIPANQLNTVYAFRIGPAAASSGVKGFSATGSMTATRGGHRVVLLPNGKALVVGGQATAEIYDPAVGTFTSAGQMRFNHGPSLAAAALNDGRVFIVGGAVTPSAAELYDPATGQFTSTASPQQPHGYNLTATLMQDGRVLVVGGLTTAGTGGTVNDTNAGAEIYDPTTGTFAPAGPMTVNRNLHTATLLNDGRVLICGGYTRGSGAPGSQQLDTAELFDPRTARFSLVGPMQRARSAHSSTLLPDGRVLLAGTDFNDPSAELFDPLNNSFTPTGSMTSAARSIPNATLLSSGQVLIVGGQNGAGQYNAAGDLYSPQSGTFQSAGNMLFPRFNSASVRLPDGRVLITGGGIAPGVGTASAELFTPTVQGLVTSQTGLTFRSSQGSAAVISQSLAVLSPTDDIPWNVSVKTYAGGGWLSAAPATSRSAPGAAPVILTVNVNPAGLAAQDFYGAVTLTPTDQKHPPITVTVVFSIVPAGAAAPLQVSPTGLVFLTSAGASPQPRSFSITNVSSRAVTFTATTSATFLTVTPLNGAVLTGNPTNVSVRVSSDTLGTGVYRGSIKLSFSDGSVQTVDILLVVSPAGSSDAGRGAAAACAPTKLLPVLTSLAAGATAPIAWPASLIVQIVDDCGNAINGGNVVASFTNGDPPVSLIGVGAGVWNGTWVPARNSSNTTVRVDARVPQPVLNGTVQVPLQVASNPKVPVIFTGGVVSAGDYSSGPAAGLHVAVFGSALADGAAGFTQTPLPRQIGSTQVFLGDKELPVVYVSDGQINVLVPYETPLNTPLSMLVTRASAISVPVNVAVFDAQPAILSTAGNGIGQGHIYKALPSGAQILSDTSSPATAGDVLVMYCVGLGAVTPAVTSGEATPIAPLTAIAPPVRVSIGGRTATPAFAGLTPGFVGLYQVNVEMPSGVAAGDKTPVSISVGGKSSPVGITMAVK